MTGTGKAMVKTPAMAHRPPTNLPQRPMGRMSAIGTTRVLASACLSLTDKKVFPIDNKLKNFLKVQKRSKKACDKT
uniref:Uncharacterized protein n=1 Tax=Romanomermis culicivorax TaxID=13658 RepID=A0A915LBQ7_ROMCU